MNLINKKNVKGNEMMKETKLTEAQVANLGLTEEQIRFCASQPYPISGRIVGNDSHLLNDLTEARARNAALVRFQLFPRKRTNRQCAEYFGVSPSTWARWISMDATPPAVVAFKAALRTAKLKQPNLSQPGR